MISLYLQKQLGTDTLAKPTAMNHNAHCDFFLPAEWSPQSGVQLTWPHAGTDWKPYLDDITQTFLKMACEITKRELLLVVTPDKAHTKTQLAKILDRDSLLRVIIREIDTNDTWARDHAPLTLTSTHQAKGFFVKNHLLDFKFNGWGEKFNWQKDNAINLQLYYDGVFQAALENHSDFVLEGGSIESDGQGTIMTTTSCMLAPHRNQPLNKHEIDERLRILFHADRIIWLDHGRLIGDDTDGHIDTIVRMAPHDTLLYVGCDDKEDAHYDDFAALEQQLRELKTASGKAYNLLRLPMPTAIYDGKDRLPATYANFVILNGAVLVPTYAQPQKDQQALATIQRAFPEREVIGIDATTAIRQHGSLHCLTMQYPEGVLGQDKEEPAPTNPNEPFFT